MQKNEEIFEKFTKSINTGDPSWSFFRDNTYSQEQVVMKVKLLNLIIKFTIKFNHIDIIKQQLIWNLNSQFLIYHLFNFVNTFEFNNTILGYDIINDIKKITQPKSEVFKPLINTMDFQNKFFINIFELIDTKKLSKLKLQKKGDSHFISTGFSSESQLDKQYKDLDELEQLIFKTKILKESNEDFLNSIMFFYKKINGKNWEIELDSNKQKYRTIYTNKITRNIRNYYKNLLETKFNDINNEHIATLEKLGLNIPEEEISEDIELSAQLEDELNKLNDTKYKLFQKTQEDMKDIKIY